MLQLLALRWWALALRGVIAVLFGLLTFFIPGVTLISLVLLFGFYAILDGIFDIVSAMKAPGHHWPLLVEGIVGIVAGIVTFMWPGITAMFLLYLIAFWAILTGVLEIVAGIRLREVIANEMLLILMGVISLSSAFSLSYFRARELLRLSSGSGLMQWCSESSLSSWHSGSGASAV